jgi:hypothetical protein
MVDAVDLSFGMRKPHRNVRHTCAYSFLQACLTICTFLKCLRLRTDVEPLDGDREEASL